ncbi:G-D-S-L family lipolytic protein [Rhodococcus triatomae]|nr:GDSL-type esterase/lipase family protein [Rhodococcus triatomae]QNG20531.1 G-D-S-L family lipolytic protein [Rhodococcus triatomae]QNG23551.1 G-D-S-L family lipolytic protein [Rhodococcus triatomae]
MLPRTTVVFFGDSFVAGIGDPSGLGWTTRLTADRAGESIDLTAYNLGIRRNTSSDVRDRWERELSARELPGSASRIVLSFGVNDCVAEDGCVRVPAATSVRNLESIVCRAGECGLPVMFVGPPPVADTEINARLEAADKALLDVARDAGAAATSVFGDLLRDEIWMEEVRAGDGAHPGAEGYRRFADLVRPTWSRWLAE